MSAQVICLCLDGKSDYKNEIGRTAAYGGTGADRRRTAEVLCPQSRRQPGFSITESDQAKHNCRIQAVCRAVSRQGPEFAARAALGRPGATAGWGSGQAGQ